MADEAMRRRIALIAPHANRALLINKAIDSRQSEAATFAETLDGLNVGIFLLDTGCRIVHANAAGHDMLCADDFLRSVGGRLVTRDVKADQGLRDIFAGIGDISIGAGGVALPLTAHDGQRYVAHLLPLTSAARSRTGMVYKAVAALFVRKMALDNPCDEMLARAFKLTPSELRVLAAVSEVGGVSAVAGALGISEATVKTHLQHLFAKTGTNRQTDLVKLVAAYASPLRQGS
jgi:DNA-binding CsgD family transcriptional regulator